MLERVLSLKSQITKFFEDQNALCKFSEHFLKNRCIELSRQSTRFICMFTRMMWLFHNVIVLQIFANNHIIRVNMHIKRVDCLYNSIHRYMIRLWCSRAKLMEVRVLNKSQLL